MIFSRIRAFAVAGMLTVTIGTPQALIAEIRFAPRAEGADETSLAPMIERVLPGVVSIAVTGRQQMAGNPLFSDPFFRQFFDLPEDGAPQERVIQSAGSGVIIDAEVGLILTNAHVIADADRITVRLSDGRELQADVLGVDAETDVAALTIDADNLAALIVGHSDMLRVGDHVVALGNPFGLEQTVTSGIVSALGRSGLGIEGYESFIQVDAPINPGNSGGALVNLRGELVGLNTAIVGPTGGNVGIGFAVPIDIAINVTQRLIADGEVRRGQVGVVVQDLTPALAEVLGLSGRTGALVADVLAGSPAEAAGILNGDIIAAVNGVAVLGSADLRTRLGLMEPGTEVSLSIVHEGEQVDRMVVLAARPGAEVDGVGDTADIASIPALEGVSLRSVETGAGRNGMQPGVLVEWVEPSSAAAAAGLKPGDVIAGVNRHEVRTPDEIAEVAADALNAPLLLRVFRQGHALFLVVP